jgi:hypothetical protein
MCVFDAGNLSLDDDLCALGKIGQVDRTDGKLSWKRGSKQDANQRSGRKIPYNYLPVAYNTD